MMQTTTARRMLDTHGAAEYTGFARSTMAKQRLRGDGPPYVKVGGKILYPLEELDAWLDSQPRLTSTAFQAAP
jgi:predicted DNA-binding transcriptional regulator AlpA